MNEYELENFKLTAPKALNIKDISNENTPLGKAWLAARKAFAEVNVHIDTGLTITGSGVSKFAIPTGVPTGV